MIPLTSDYEIRMLDIQSFINVYTPLILEEYHKCMISFVPWTEDIESAFEWMISESIQNEFNCRVINHFKSDLGLYILDHITSFSIDFKALVSQIRYSTGSYKPKHIKTMVVGSILIVALLRKEDK